MKKQYEMPSVNVITFATEEILLVSGGIGGENETEIVP